MCPRHGGNIREAKKKYGLSGENIIDFSANINPLGIMPEIRKKLISSIDSIIHYPDIDYKALKTKIARHEGINPENVFVGNGSVELLFLICRALMPKTALIPVPAFMEYQRAVNSVKAKTIFLKSKEKDGFNININTVISRLKDADILFLCNPNNPTGNLLSKNKLRILAKECKKKNVTLVIDEAFIDFLPEASNVSLIRDTLKNSKIIVLRSLTKFYAVPGLRIGYLSGEKNLIKKLHKYHYPWNVNTFAQTAAAEFLSYPEYTKKTHDVISKERNFIYKEIKSIGKIKPFLSSANFVLFKLENTEITSSRLTTILGKKGILIRDCSDFRGLNDKYARIAIRTRKDNICLIKAIKNILQ